MKIYSKPNIDQIFTQNQSRIEGSQKIKSESKIDSTRVWIESEWGEGTLKLSINRKLNQNLVWIISSLKIYQKLEITQKSANN